MHTIGRKPWLVALALLLCLVSATCAQAATRQDVARKLEYYRQFFVDFQYAPDAGIPGELLDDCYGVIIVRQYKAGFIWGAKGGDGVIFMHDRATGEWSPPAFIRTAEASFGFQAGGQAVDAIILIMNQSGVDMLLKTRFMIGVDASATAGPVGRDLGAQVGAGAALLTYSRSKGLFAGAAFEGGAMFNHDSYNSLLYGRQISVRDIILNRRLPMPPEALPMVETLRSYGARNTARRDATYPDSSSSYSTSSSYQDTGRDVGREVGRPAPFPRPTPGEGTGTLVGEGQSRGLDYTDSARTSSTFERERELRQEALEREREAKRRERELERSLEARRRELERQRQLAEERYEGVSEREQSALDAEARRAAAAAKDAAEAARAAAAQAERAAARAEEARRY